MKTLFAGVEALGGRCDEVTVEDREGMPHWQIRLPFRIFYDVEFRRPGKSLSAIQQKERHELEQFGFPVFVLVDDNDVRYFLDRLERDLDRWRAKSIRLNNICSE